VDGEAQRETISEGAVRYRLDGLWLVHPDDAMCEPVSAEVQTGCLGIRIIQAVSRTWRRTTDFGDRWQRFGLICCFSLCRPELTPTLFVGWERLMKRVAAADHGPAFWRTACRGPRSCTHR